uniref:Uncharacterized protein n=1 Tax=Pygocentrus nattereri TaxID=42514 RepID=A0AAR2J0W6_PYGNA
MQAVLLILNELQLFNGPVKRPLQSKCPQFFFGHLPSAKRVATPTVLRGRKYKQICQRWKNQYRFATLYDTKSRIPVYSAYTYNSSNQFPRDKYWKVEPQVSKLEHSDTSSFSNGDSCGKITRGHLFPKSYAADQDQGDSTFTLTNIAPQTQECNNQWAEQVEEPMLRYIKTKCKLSESIPAYIVTGVVPGNTWLKIKRGNRTIKQGVNIPSHYWTAFTCANNKGKVSHAYIAQQIHCKDNRENRFTEQEKISVAELEEKLTDLYNQPFSVFRNTKI